MCSYMMIRGKAIVARIASAGASALGLLFLVVLPAAHGQQAGRMYTVGILSTGSPAAFDDIGKAMRAALGQLSYVEKRNILFESRFDEGIPGRLERLAAELVRMNVNVLVTNGTPASLAAKHATSSIPIVTVSTGDPVGSGLVQSLGRPGGNVTGVSAAFGELAGKWVELLREIVPGLSRIAFLGNADNAVNKVVFRRVQAVARGLGVSTEYFSATKPDEVTAALARLHEARVQGVIVPGDAVIRSRRKEITEFAAKVRLPAVYFGGDYIDAGGLMSYGPVPQEIGRRAAAYVDRILRGAKPADLPVEEPTVYELAISLKTARTMGLTIPQTLLLRADRLIE